MKTVDHPLPSRADARHIDVPVAMDDAKLCAALKKGGDLSGVDDILAGEARYVRAGSAKAFVLDISDTLSLCSKVPGEEFTAFSTADDDGIVLFRGSHGESPWNWI
jgi:hypothetical protein